MYDVVLESDRRSVFSCGEDGSVRHWSVVGKCELGKYIFRPKATHKWGDDGKMTTVLAAPKQGGPAWGLLPIMIRSQRCVEPTLMVFAGLEVSGQKNYRNPPSNGISLVKERDTTLHKTLVSTL